ncbi:MAG: serine hydrolase [Legionellaceae bacterium]|nr:serine hydrolase [Legionellaceae bacterium]
MISQMLEIQISTDDARLSKVEHRLTASLSDKDKAGMSLPDRLQHYHVPDVSIAIIDGNSITARSYHSKEALVDPSSPETILQAGSISKMVTAVIALKLVEDGRLSLDKPVNTQLKDYQIPENEHTSHEKITLRRLLSHTAGLSMSGFPGYASSLRAEELPSNTAVLQGGYYLMIASTLPSSEEIDRLHLEHSYIFTEDDSKLFYIDLDGQLQEKQLINTEKFQSTLQQLYQLPPSSTETETSIVSPSKKITVTDEQIHLLINGEDCEVSLSGVAFTPKVEPIQTPGSAFRYSGGGTLVIQQLIMETVGEDRSFADIAKEMIFDPLSMTSSTFALQDPNSPDYVIAKGHVNDGSTVEGGFNLYPELAAAGLWTTPTDLAKFVIGIQNNVILNETTTAAMLTQQQNSPCGLGPFVNPDAHEFSHTAGTAGFSASCVGFSNGILKGAIVMTNSDNGSPLCQEINRSIAVNYGWPKEYSDYPIAVQNPSRNIITPLLGDYDHPTHTGPEKLTLFERDNCFFINIPFPTPTSPPVECEIKQQSENVFYFITPNGAPNKIVIPDGQHSQFELFDSVATKKINPQAAPHSALTPEKTTEYKNKMAKIKHPEPGYLASTESSRQQKHDKYQPLQTTPKPWK